MVGIGFASATTFARHGATVVVVDRDAEAAQRTVDAIAAVGGRALAVVADYARRGRARGRRGRSRRSAGSTSCRTTSATRLGGPEELTLAEWRAAVAINLDTVFLGARRHSRTSSTARFDDQRLVHRLDPLDRLPLPGLRRVEGGGEPVDAGLALEYADRGVRVNAILPGLIDTPLVYRELSDGPDVTAVRAERAAHCPTGAMGTAQDVANAALFLACDESAYVTGTLLPVDGGLHVRVI